ncbi:cation-translocating P-type ATPase [Dongia sp.]|uniref:cation-translocating P-type ATPase n=1 Tax=Dongia sp. TaxID=1977262 RepID=UPI0035AE918A
MAERVFGQKTAQYRGLADAAAREKHLRDGPNELPQSGGRSVPIILRDVLKEPMLALLLCGGLIYLIVGSTGEALILLAFATFSVLVTLIQESRTERVLEALRDLSSPRALVIRDGVRKRIPGRELVQGDLVVLGEGDRIPADLSLIDVSDLLTDESLLTGESVPVRKQARTGAASAMSPRPGGDDLAVAFSGALVVRGTGLGEVTAIGAQSEIGKIGESLRSLTGETPRLQAQTGRLVRIFAGIAAFCSIAVILLYGFYRDAWLEGFLAGITLGMSLIPEEFPVVLTVFTAMGAWRISHARVLTRRAATIETLGAATILCTDKTGTLTENRMSLAELRPSSAPIRRLDSRAAAPLPQDCIDLARTGILASAAVPFDPMERAFHDLTPRLPDTAPLQLLRSYGLRPDLLAMSNVWRREDGSCFVAVKGAPEAIALLCRLPASEIDSLQVAVDEMGRDGMRVLGVARAEAEASALPETQSDFAFTFLGLAGLTDPLRADVPKAVAQCRSAGIRVVMITGDYPATARAVATQAGINATSVLTGTELDTMDDATLAERITDVGVFARILPQQKLRLVDAFKRGGDVVAMTGDGVNDAPSLKAAHIGIAMGGRGTDVAREASSIVLLDDDFSSIVSAIRLGRRIYDNLRKAMGFIIAVHVPIAGLALLPLLFGLPILFGPIHIAFLEMVIDPACTLVFEAEQDEDDVMKRPARDPVAPLFSPALMTWSSLQGVATFVVTASAFVATWALGMAEDEIRALVFTTLILCLVALILVNRSFSPSLRRAIAGPNLALGLVLALVGVILGAIILLPSLRELFHFGSLHLPSMTFAFASALGLWLGLELLKRFFRRRLSV